MKRKWIAWMIALIFISLFLYTGISKLQTYDLFVEQLGESSLLAPAAGWISWALPVAEFVVAFLLLIPRYRLMGFFASLTLMILFTGYIVAIFLFSKELPCSCGGIIQDLSWGEHLVLNLTLTGLACWGVWIQKKAENEKMLRGFNASIVHPASIKENLS